MKSAKRKPGRIPVTKTVTGLLRDPIRTFERMGARHAGDVARLNLGVFKPILLTRPEHVQHVLRDNVTNYQRDGMMWRPLRHLVGNGIATDGDQWKLSRSLLQPLFSSKRIANHLDAVAETIGAEVDALAAHAGETVRSEEAMTRIMHRALVRVFFGGRINVANADRLCHAVGVVTESIATRMLLPFVPLVVPLPGDRARRRAVRTTNRILMPLVREARKTVELTDHSDIASMLCNATDENGRGLSDKRIRDDIIAIFTAGTETTATAMTWLWVVLEANPEVAERLYAEIDRVVGEGPARPQHIPELRYLKMVLQELLRLYPVAWVLPRTVKNDDVIDGVRIPAGGTVLLSPLLTHRMPELWPDPLTFDPERFSPENEEKRPRYSYFPFGGGMHLCLGSHLFMQEACLAVATVLTRLRPQPVGAPAVPRAGAALRPSQPVEIMLRPRGQLVSPSSH